MWNLPIDTCLNNVKGEDFDEKIQTLDLFESQ